MGLWTGLQTHTRECPRLRVGLLPGPWVLVLPSGANAPAREAPSANTDQQLSVCPAGFGALAVPLNTGGRLTPAFLASQKRGYAFGSAAFQTNRFGPRGRLPGAGVRG